MSGSINQSIAPANAVTAWRFKTFLGLLFAVIFAGKFAYFYDGVLADPDSWWHVKSGLDILSNWRLPVTDPYSYTFAGQPWIAKEWLSQIVLAAAYRIGGWNAVALLSAAMIFITGVIVYLFFSARLRPHLAVLIAIAAMTLSGGVLLARPHLLVMPVLVIWAASIFRAADELKAPRFALLGLLVIWANLHGSFTLGMIIAGFGMLHVIEQTRFRDKRLAAKWALFVLLCPLASLLTPYFYGPLLISIEMARGNEANQFISEWMPFDAQIDSIQEKALLIFLLALLMLRLRMSWSKALFMLLTLHMFLAHSRFSYVFFMLAPMALAAELSGQFLKLSAATWVGQPRDKIENFTAQYFKPILSASLVALAAASWFYLASPNIRPGPDSGPLEAIAYAKNSKLNGNVFNHYNFGGPLIFSGIKTFVDGRAEQIFQGGFITKAMESAKMDGEKKFKELLADYNIAWTLLLPEDGRVALLDTYPEWQRAYSDPYAVIHIRKASQPQP